MQNALHRPQTRRGHNAGKNLFNTIAKLLFGIAIAVDPGALSAQTTIADRAECPRCRLVQEKLTTIGGLHDDDALAQTFVIDRDAHGRIYVAPYFLTGQIKVFEPGGKLWKVIGRRGPGPGEFQSVRAIRVAGDTLYVYDNRLLRISALTLDGRFLRSITMPFLQPAPNGLWLVDEHILVSGANPSRDGAGLPLHFLNRNGALLQSFGSAGAYHADSSYPLWRSVAAAGNGEFWTFPVTEYRLQKWDRNGKLLQTLTRDVEWFKPWWTYPVSLPSPPYGAAVSLDERGRIWTMTMVPAPDQARYRNQQGASEVKAGNEWEDEQKAFDTAVEVIDPRTGRLVYSGRIDQKIISGLTGGVFAGFRQGPDGISYFDIWRFRLVDG